MGEEPVRFGIIGCGVISDWHAKAIRDTRGAELVAVLDVVEERARRVGETHSVRSYTDEEEFIRHPGLDAVTVATPSGMHLEGAEFAARAGKHVLCEKPLEITVERCRRLIETCRKNGVRLGGVFQSRAAEPVRAVHRAIQEGRFGRIAAIEASLPWYRTQEYYDSGDWRGTWKLDGGGALMNQGIHMIDVFQWLGGPVESIWAIADTRAHVRIEVEDVAVAAVRFRSGALGTIMCTTAAWPGDARTIRVSGEKGKALLRDSKLVTFEFQEPREEDKPLFEDAQRPADAPAAAADPKAMSHGGHMLQVEDFARAVRTGAEPMVTGEEAAKSVEVILAIYKSAQTGEPVRLPLEETPRLSDMKVAAEGVREIVAAGRPSKARPGAKTKKAKPPKKRSGKKGKSGRKR